MKKYLAVFGKPRYLGIFSCEEDISNGESILVESSRGPDIAISVGLLNEEQEASYRALRNTIDRGDNAPKMVEAAVSDLKFKRLANEKELNEQSALREEEQEVLKIAKELVIPHELDMKLIDVEYLSGKQKLFIYFSADQRVDFRAYVRDLAREFKTRIELRQVGVRDEAKIIGGLGLCGCRCCCSYWMHQFAPVGIKMVKEQNLALNPAKISGICGRLLCCMCYEENVYHELWEGLPQAGTKLKSALGNVTVSGLSVRNKAVKCYIPEHGEKEVPIDKFKEFQTALEEGKDWEDIEQLIMNIDPCAECQAFENAEIFLKKPVKNLAKFDRAERETEKENLASQKQEEQSKEETEHKRPRKLIFKSRQRVTEPVEETQDFGEDEDAMQTKQARPHNRPRHRFKSRRKSRDAE